MTDLDDLQAGGLGMPLDEARERYGDAVDVIRGATTHRTEAEAAQLAGAGAEVLARVIGLGALQPRKYPGMLADPTCPCDLCAETWQRGSDANMLHLIVLPMLERMFRLGAGR